MDCPKCRMLLKCPCKACRESKRGFGVFYTWSSWDTQGCPICGFEAHIDWWGDYEYELYRDQEDRIDGHAALRALEDGDFIPWEDVKSELLT